ncbi:MAG: hypothetical protein ACI4WM_03375, partial [Erysipelotrichaceae bacterium]
VEIKNKNVKKIIRIILIVFLILDIVILMPTVIFNLYILIMKLIKTGDLSFSFNGGAFYYSIAFPFVMLNTAYRWVFIIVGFSMRMCKMKKSYK